MAENKVNFIEEMKELVNLEKKELIVKTKIYCSYDDITNKIRSNLESTSQKFIEIGYLLKKVKESEIYKICECNSIYEYAKINFGLGETTTKNFFDDKGNEIQLCRGKTFIAHFPAERLLTYTTK